MRIGFIGLGNMGGPMARNLAEAGYEVAGFDISAQIPPGVQRANSAREAAKAASIVITMLPDGDALSAVAKEILPEMQQESCLLDCSTVDVKTTAEISTMAHRAAIHMVDAPVSGGVTGAEAGSLTFMAGGSAAGFEMVQPLFEIMGQKSVHCGDSGASQAAKICNNMILGINMIGTCEAMVLADRLGLERQKLFDVVSTSSGYSWVMNAYCPAPGIGPKSPADNDYKPGFSAELMLKDLRLAQAAAELTDADTPLGSAATLQYEMFVDNEKGRGQDFSAMLPRFEGRKRGDKR